jgi:hypothetical protein
MNKYYVVFIITFLFSITNINAAGKVDNIIRAGANKGDDFIGLAAKNAIKLGAKNGDNTGRFVLSHIDDITKTAARNGDNILQAGLKQGDDIIKDFTRVHKRINSERLVRLASSKIDETADIAKNGVKNIDFDNAIRFAKDNSDNIYKRPGGGQYRGLRKEVYEKILEDAPKTSDGKFIDPNTFQPIADGFWDIGHKTGYEFRNLRSYGQSQNMTREQFLDFLNNPDFYQIEDHFSNISHKFEAF